MPWARWPGCHGASYRDHGDIPHGMTLLIVLMNLGIGRSWLCWFTVLCSYDSYFIYDHSSFSQQKQMTNTQKLSPQTKSNRSWGCETMTNPMHVYTVMTRATILGDGPSVQWEWSPDAHNRWWCYEPALHQRDVSEIVRFARVANLRDRLWYYGTRNWEIDESSSTGSANDPCTTS